MIPVRNLQDITEGDIQRLIDNRLPESRTLDYKRDWPSERKSIEDAAQDVCAFANSLGGDIVFGLEEDRENGGPLRICPIKLDNTDVAGLTFTNAMRDLLEPQIGKDLSHFAIPVAGGHVIVVRIGSSANAPHRVRGKNFFVRNSVGKEPMDMHAIRSAFLAQAAIPERLHRFRAEALSRITSPAAIIPNVDFPACVLHAVPLSALTREEYYPFAQLLTAAGKMRSGLRWSAPNPAAMNLYGAILRGADRNGGKSTGYAEIYRNGIIEWVGGSLIEGTSLDPHGLDRLNPGDTKGIAPYKYEDPLYKNGLRCMADAFTALGITEPIYLAMTWLTYHPSSNNVYVDVGEYRSLPTLAKIEAQPIYWDNFAADALTTLKPAFDVLWNAVGIPERRGGVDR